MATVAIIPARKGSKGLPGKNHKPLHNKPLIAWTIEQAIKSAVIDEIVISTDDPAIVNIAEKYNSCHVIERPPEIAGDSAPMADVVLDVINRFQEKTIDFIVLLQVTSPLRTASDIDDAFKDMKAKNYENCVSVCDVSESPYWMYKTDEKGLISPVVEYDEVSRRQDLPTAYKLNGAIYIVKTANFIKDKKLIGLKTFAYKMPRERSIDIDNIEDFRLCERYLSEVESELTGDAHE